MSIIELGDRLKISRTPDEQKRHREELRNARRAAAARAQRSKQRAKKLQRTAPWADPAAIAAFYRKAANLTRGTNIRFEVDHIIPLRGKLVSGLHVETNLQVIPRKVNRAKSNHFNDEVVGGAGVEPATSTV